MTKSQGLMNWLAKHESVGLGHFSPADEPYLVRVVREAVSL